MKVVRRGLIRGEIPIYGTAGLAAALSRAMTSSAPVEIQILDDAAGLITGVAQACEDTIDELTLGAVEIQGFFCDTPVRL